MKKIFIALFLFASLGVVAQPSGYYSTALGKNGAALQTELKNIIDNHSAQSFPLWGAFSSTDNKGSNILWDMYSDVPGGTPSYTYTIGSDQCGQYNSEGDCYNHEHLWPKTNFNDASPMNSDLHHVVPTDGWVNNKRANFPLGTIKSGGLSWTGSNGTMTGTSNDYNGYTGKVFEPIDEYKGDIARIYFYMSTRYKGEDGSWKNWEMANGAVLSNDAKTLLLQWHNADTVSQKEIDRNNAVYAIQGNRNPFIDYPQFADCIWGTANCTPLNVQGVLLDKVKVYPNPASDNLQISLPTELQGKDFLFNIYNTFGQKVLTVKQANIDISELSAGLYSIRVQGAESSAAFSFVKK